MESLLFNVNNGYIEGILRGYRNDLLRAGSYSQLTQCNSLDDLKTQLAQIYGDYINNIPNPISTSAIADCATRKLVDEFQYIRAQSTGSMTEFFNYMTYGYMIDNVALLITGTLHNRDTRELLARCHPLGWFEQLPILCVATTTEELYNMVLVDTPLAPYFKASLSSGDFDDKNIEIIRNTLYKAYLEDFYDWCVKRSDVAGTPTSELMAEILEFEADRRAINITMNSFGADLTPQDRANLYPNIGRLYPEGTNAMKRATSMDELKAAVAGVSEYRQMFDQSGFGNQSDIRGGPPKSLEDLFYQKEMELSKMTFTQQFTYAAFFAWVKLQEQEVRNITWIAECIAQQQKERINNYIAVF